MNKVITGIWKHSDSFSEELNEVDKFTLNEGTTPCEKVSFPTFLAYLKREDKNPTGSHKDRCFAYLLSMLRTGKYNFNPVTDSLVLSSSGNAAISAAAYSRIAGIKLDIFISPTIRKDKLLRLSKFSLVDFPVNFEIRPGDIYEKGKITIHVENRARTEAFRFAKENEARLFRAANDPLSIDGYTTISYELLDQLPDVDAIFIPCSSGATVAGIYKGFRNSKKNIPQIHIVQSQRINPIARQKDSNFQQSDQSIVSAIVDRSALRKEEILGIIEKTNGNAWIVEDDHVRRYWDILRDMGVNCSAEGGLTVGAIAKAIEQGYKFNKPVALITGIE